MKRYNHILTQALITFVAVIVAQLLIRGYRSVKLSKEWEKAYQQEKCEHKKVEVIRTVYDEPTYYSILPEDSVLHSLGTGSYEQVTLRCKKCGKETTFFDEDRFDKYFDKILELDTRLQLQNAKYKSLHEDYLQLLKANRPIWSQTNAWNRVFTQ